MFVFFVCTAAGSTRPFIVFHSYGGCQADSGWMVISEGTACGDEADEWLPPEGVNSSIPQIRYATNLTAKGFITHGQMSEAAENAIADTMVVWVNPSDSSTFGKLFEKPSSTGQYINVYQPYETVNWFDAKDYCMDNFASSLASVHSSDDETELLDSRVDTSVWTWVGFNDINNESIAGDTSLGNNRWQWTDGSDFDYALNWGSGQPDDAGSNEDCGMYYPQGTANDYVCESGQLHQFICGEEINWRPVFKINDNVSESTVVSTFWSSGTATYSSYNLDISYVLNSFDASTLDANNYRSLVIDDWTRLYSRGNFDKVKVGIYNNGSEVAYFVYEASSDTDSWYSNENLIDSAYYNAKFDYNDSQGYWSIAGMTFPLCFFLFFFFFFFLLCLVLREQK